jgi:hypothetical protein
MLFFRKKENIVCCINHIHVTRKKPENNNLRVLPGIREIIESALNN